MDYLASDEIGGVRIFDLSDNFDWHLESDVDYLHRSLDFVPIGNTPGDNIIVSGVRAEHRGKVASYQLRGMNAEAPLVDVFHAANSFDDFLDSVYPMS